MVTGVCRLEIMLYDSGSLKDKRRVLRSLTDKVKSRYNVSVAEVGNNEKWQTAAIGISTVSNSTVQVKRVLDTVVKFIETDGRVEITGYHMEII